MRSFPPHRLSFTDWCLPALLLMIFASQTSLAATFQEQGGVILMEVESAPSVSGWSAETTLSGFTGTSYYRATKASSASGGKGLLEYPIVIQNAGEYQLQWRSYIVEEGTTTDANDSFVRLVDQSGNPVTPIENNLTPTGSWYKIYMNTANKWHWQASNRDHDPKAVAWDLAAGGQYTLQISYRSIDHAIDRILLWNRSGGFGHNFGNSKGQPKNAGTADGFAESTTINEPPAPIGDDGDGSVSVSGELKQWHKVNLDLSGPWASEGGDPNPTLDYRMTVTFSQGGTSLTVPGYFAADGAAHESSAVAGNIWRAHFMPPTTGSWNYEIDFRSGDGVVLTSGGLEPSPFDGATGSFVVAESDKSGRDFRSREKGKLVYTGKPVLEWSGGGGHFIKMGCNSPEVFLEFEDFDGTAATRDYSTHVSDWESGDPTWKSGQGRGIIGVVNYLSEIGINGHYFLTMNAYGDGGIAFPWTGQDNFYTYDTSKLAQWQVVFDHMMEKGIMPQFVLTEQENQSYFEYAEGGTFADSRKVYFREMVARFGYLNAITWNIGEESGWQRSDTGRGLAVTDDQRKAFAAYLRTLLEFEDHIIVHNGPSNTDAIFTPLVGDPSYTGISFQGNFNSTNHGHGRIVHWREASQSASRPWVVYYDEPYSNSDFPNLGNWRKNSLWASLSGGASGVGYYAGGGRDLQIQDYSAYSGYWEDMVRARVFMESLPGKLPDYVPADNLVSSGWCLANPGVAYFTYLPSGGTTTLDLSGQSGEFEVSWFDPRNGGFHSGNVTQVSGGGTVAVGNPPSSSSSDWAVLVRKPTRVAYIYGDVSASGSVPSGSDAPYDQMLLSDSGPTGLSLFKSMVEEEGFVIEGFYDAVTTLDESFLAPYDVIIFGLHQKNWSGTEKAALDAWLRGGGGMLIYSDSAAGGLWSSVGAQNTVGQSVVNNLIGDYGMEVTVDQANGVKAYRAGPGASHPIVVGRPTLEGEGVSPIATDPSQGVQVLIPYSNSSDFKVSGNPDIPYQQNLSIGSPEFAALALASVGAGNVVAVFDRQPLWNDGPGSDIEERDNQEILRRIVRYLAGNLVSQSPPPTSQATFGNGGLPWAVGGSTPTRIEAENFDEGGAGLAYSDTTSGNEGSSNYRQGEDVDLGSNVATEPGGSNIGWIANNEWWEYTINVEGGIYHLDARVASDASSPGDLDWVLGGTPLGSDGLLLGAMDVQDTGGWQAWETLRLESVALPAGTHVLRLEADGGSFNLNWFELQKVSAPGRVFDQAYLDTLFASDPRGTSGPHTDFEAKGNGHLRNGLIYAFGIDSLEPGDAIGKLPASKVVAGHLEFTFRRISGGSGTAVSGYSAGGVSYTVELSHTLEGSWRSGDTVFEQVGNPVDLPDGMESVTLRTLAPVASSQEERDFVRVRVQPEL